MPKVVIPSYKRAGRAYILKFIPKSYKENLFLMVREEEVAEYTEHYGDHATIIALPKVDGIAETRQALVEHFAGQRIWMIDDDLRLYKSFIDVEKKIEIQTAHKLTEDEFYLLMERIGNLMDEGYAWGGVHLKMFPLRGYNKFPQQLNSFNRSNYFYDLSVIPMSLFKFTDVTFAEDIYQWLTLFTAGFQHITITDFIVRLGLKSNSGGGCSTYRDISKQNKDVLFINEKFPAFTKLIHQKWELNIPNPNNEEILTVAVHTKRSRAAKAELRRLALLREAPTPIKKSLSKLMEFE